jgi:hypothetical protein
LSVVRRFGGGALLLLLLSGTTACRPATVDLSYRPEPGATYRYVVDVVAETVTSIDGEEPRRNRQEVELVEEHAVAVEPGSDDDDESVRVRVLVGQPGSTAQAFVVRFDRAAQLRAIDVAEGASPDLTGAVGVAEIFPGAGAAPDRHVGPGTTWSTARKVTLTGDAEPTTLRTTGRFVDFAVDGDRKLARVESTTRLPLRSDDGRIALAGTEVIEQRVTYDVEDGSVHEASATTTGRFRLVVQPPEGVDAEPARGTLVLTVRSATRRTT